MQFSKHIVDNTPTGNYTLNSSSRIKKISPVRQYDKQLMSKTSNQQAIEENETHKDNALISVCAHYTSLFGILNLHLSHFLSNEPTELIPIRLNSIKLPCIVFPDFKKLTSTLKPSKNYNELLFFQ